MTWPHGIANNEYLDIYCIFQIESNFNNFINFCILEYSIERLNVQKYIWWMYLLLISDWKCSQSQSSQEMRLS